MTYTICTSDPGTLKNILDGISASVQIVGPDGKFLDCNAATLRQFRVGSVHDIIGHLPSEFSPEKQNDGTDSGFASQKFVEQALNGELVSFEWDHRRSDGTVFPCQVTLNKIEYEKKICLLSTTVEITEIVSLRKKSEFIVQNAPTPIMDINPDLSIRTGNNAFGALVDLSFEELKNIKLTDFDIRSRVGGSLSEGLALKQDVSGEMEAVVPAGTVYLQYYYKPFYSDDGNLVSIIAYYINKTEEKTAVKDILALTDRCQAGHLDARLDVARYHGEIRNLTEGINKTLDSIIGPLNVAAEYVDRISKGDLPQKITDDYSGDFNEIKNNLNTCIDSLKTLIGDTNEMYKAQKAGDIEAFIPLDKYPGFYRDIVSGYNDVAALHVSSVLKILSVLASYAEGNFEPVLERLPGKQTLANEKLDLLRNNILNLIADCNLLIQSSLEGNLEKRADGSKHLGDYRKIIEGINATLDAIVRPMQDAAVILERMAVNDHSTGMDESAYKGSFADFARSINLVRTRVNHIADSIIKIADGDMSDLEEYRQIGRRSEKDRVVPGLIKAFSNLQALTDETLYLVKAASEGNFNVRVDVANHEGEYRRIIVGVNEILDSVITPVKEAIRVCQEYANSNFFVRVDSGLQVAGEWIGFKNALDNIGIHVCDAILKIQMQVQDLATYAEEATASTEEVSSGAQQIAKNAGGVSANAEQGEDGIEQVLKAMEDLTITVGEVSQRAELVSVSASEANTISKNGIGLAKKSESAMTGIMDSTREVDEIVKDINRQMDEIGKIVRLITDISNQTNLLALNAAIEAARAGEAGRGFAVVAAEVKSLAQDSRASAENIAEMISALQSKASKANDAIKTAGNVVVEGSDALKETLGAFTKIADSVEDITKNAMDVASASEEQAASVEEITASVNEVSGLIQNTSKEAGNAAAATEEASASLEQISKVISNVSSIAESISREMAQFKV
ncbi:methyl-accepting chemotaxis protein [Methanospirillum stamsii]|uniref:methyl-accepting chemotaxis protein n=1 Tax=Methanospirillum stamsii TaxID=1277351 RepID=UPI0015E83D86|nr:methyl-accepting chemotaxis protein [Methanospirillum stamsii]